MKLVYNFGSDKTEGDASKINILGSKGANLAEMSLLGIPVPPGFTISLDACQEYFSNGKKITTALTKQVTQALENIENFLDLKLGDNSNPLLLSVRSGSSVSMPGMMDSILNLGLNDITVEALARKTKNQRFAYDCYRRFIQMYGNVVLGIDSTVFNDLIELIKQDHGVIYDSDLSLSAIKNLIEQNKNIIKQNSDINFPQSVKQQLYLAIKGVFGSCLSKRAITYRRINNLPSNLGTAVNIQAMVFGNMDKNSATGVAFTRNPSCGAKNIYGEYLVNAQGEDVVSGTRTPQVINNVMQPNDNIDYAPLEEYMPEAYQHLVNIFYTLEQHFKDMQDIEFTIEQGKVWILQTRNGKRSSAAAIKIAVDMVSEKLISKNEALLRIKPESLEQMLHPTIGENDAHFILTKGLPASPGAATGKIYFDSDKVEKMAKHQDVLLVRQETSPEDINGMNAAAGILTTKGGMTSHAAVVARGMGKSCVCGASNITIDYTNRRMLVGSNIINEGDIITINGSTGDVILGQVKMIPPQFFDEFYQILKWAKSVKKIAVRANAETTRDIKNAFKFGAEGIGLCRTEHMFFNPSRINVVRGMILAETFVERQKYLTKLGEMQVEDFCVILKLASDLPINIRLLDPPLHEFLPHSFKEIEETASALNLPINIVKLRVKQLTEQNPMLGHRGCRIGISSPEIYQMQACAIFKAMKASNDFANKIEIMVPLIMNEQEFKIIKNAIDQTAMTVLGHSNGYKVGTMIELPRACLVADKIASEAQFFSFGTNDLTQTTLGLSRDDATNFLNAYYDHNILTSDPFIRIDEEGVGNLIKTAITKSKNANNKIKIGICGEHGGNPPSIEFFCKLGIDYISCSAFRIPIAILAAARSSIKLGMYNE